MARYKEKDIRGPPLGEPWIWLTRELLESDAWRSRSVNCMRLIDRLMVEHMAHAGTENGNLGATYDDFLDYGISRKYVPGAICEAESRGLIQVKRGLKKGGKNAMHRYRLTFFPVKRMAGIASVYEPATNDWRRYREKHQ